MNTVPILPVEAEQIVCVRGRPADRFSVHTETCSPPRAQVGLIQRMSLGAR